MQNQKINKQEYLSQYYDRIFIISIIIYNICYNPEIINKIITNYIKIIKRFVKRKKKTDEERLKEKSNNILYNIQINDCFEPEIQNMGVDYYLLFQNNQLIDNHIKNNDFQYFNKSDDKIKSIEKEIYTNIFEDFKIILKNRNEIKKYYIPELLFFKYLSKLES